MLLHAFRVTRLGEFWVIVYYCYVDSLRDCNVEKIEEKIPVNTVVENKKKNGGPTRRGGTKNNLFSVFGHGKAALLPAGHRGLRGLGSLHLSP
jgi:hypothetical protein